MTRIFSIEMEFSFKIRNHATIHPSILISLIFHTEQEGEKSCEFVKSNIPLMERIICDILLSSHLKWNM